MLLNLLYAVCSSFLYLCFTGFSTPVSSLKIATGKNELFYKPQHVSVGYLIVNEEINVYYQYFESRNKSSQNNLLFFFGNYIEGSAIQEAAFGYTPYYFVEDSSKKEGYSIIYNPTSVNEYTNIVVVDIVRGSGFNMANSSSNMDFELISKDMESFIDRFYQQISAENPGKKFNLFIYGGYQMAMPTALYMNSTKLNISSILGKPYLGYTSLNQLHIFLPAFGFTDRLQLNSISNNIYSLQVKDYGKDLEEMYGDLEGINDVLRNKTFMDFNNPLLSQDLVYSIEKGFKKFYTDCIKCRVYLSVHKDNWESKTGISGKLKKDLIKSWNDDLLSIINSTSRERTKNPPVLKSFLITDELNNLKMNIGSLEEPSASRVFVTDPSYIYATSNSTRLEMKLGTGVVLNITSCPDCGFYSLVEGNTAISPLMAYYQFLVAKVSNVPVKKYVYEMNYRLELLKKECWKSQNQCNK